MEQEILNKIKNDYLKLKEEREKLSKLSVELDELMQKEDVIRYLRVLEELENIDSDLQSKTDKDLINKAYSRNSSSNKKTNEIYLCLGTFISSTESDIEHGSNDIRVRYDDPRAEYRTYIDIENEFNCVNISIKDCSQFEKMHKIIYPKNFLFAMQEYYKIREEFITNSVLYSQESAIAKIMTKHS